MPYTRGMATKLLTTTELTLFDAARRGEMTSHSAPQLRVKIGRTRRLRDKYDDLYRRQRRSTRHAPGATAGPAVDANLRTRQKCELFADLLARFETRLATLDAAEARARAQAAKRQLRTSKASKASLSPVPSRRRVAAAKVASPPANFMSEAARGANARALPVRTGGVAVHAHVSSRGRRNQAKRDRRP
jgi:hypothetical protein